MPDTNRSAGFPADGGSSSVLERQHDSNGGRPARRLKVGSYSCADVATGLDERGRRKLKGAAVVVVQPLHLLARTVGLLQGQLP
jgi:hypothetical protein